MWTEQGEGGGLLQQAVLYCAVPVQQHFGTGAWRHLRVLLVVTPHCAAEACVHTCSALGSSLCSQLATQASYPGGAVTQGSVAGGCEACVA